MFCLYEQWDFNPTMSHRFIHLCPRACKNLCWWTLSRNVFRGCMIVPREPTIHFLTDASLKGWGAHWGSHNISGLWSPEEREDHINILELEVVSRALDMWLLRWAGQDVLVELDNSTAVAYLNKQGRTRSRWLSSGHTHSSSLRRSRHDIESATHSRGQERDCRCPVKKRGDCSGRVKYRPSGFPTPVQSGVLQPSTCSPRGTTSAYLCTSLRSQT